MKKNHRTLETETFSTNLFDAEGSLHSSTTRAQIRDSFLQHGFLHIVNTGLTLDSLSEELLQGLGFSKKARFTLGGRTSKDTQEKWVEGKMLRRMDYYSPENWLLPNTEIQYQRLWPQSVLFYASDVETMVGGRLFLHSAQEVEHLLQQDPSGLGRTLLSKLEQKGLLIESGFLHQDDPLKQRNYFMSWQEKCGGSKTEEEVQRYLELIEHRIDWNEYWWDRTNPAYPILMTRFSFPAFHLGVLRFPRIMADAPSRLNGFRRFAFGDGTLFSKAENTLLRQVYQDTKQGQRLCNGDLVLVDNLRFAHSREPFQGVRQVYLAMSGLQHNYPISSMSKSTPLFHTDNQHDWTRETAVRIPTRLEKQKHKDKQETQQEYVLPSNSVLWKQRMCMRIFDCSSSHWLFDDFNMLAKMIEREFTRHGMLMVRGLPFQHPRQIPLSFLNTLKFGPQDLFQWGGRWSGRTTRHSFYTFEQKVHKVHKEQKKQKEQKDQKEPDFKKVDAYPAHLYLLPHNEILYQRFLPTRLFFYCASPGGKEKDQGGRTFVHSAKLLHTFLKTDFRGVGPRLLHKLRKHGLGIETGFLDKNHPLFKDGTNFFRSWQERFIRPGEPECLQNAMFTATQTLNGKLQFDKCWWRYESGGYPTLMTKITVPAFNSQGFLLFPRIALDKPCVGNGHRRYTLGNGQDLTPEEKKLLLIGFLRFRQGVSWKKGDLLLVDNFRYGHSRESYAVYPELPRQLGVLMAGFQWTTDTKKEWKQAWSSSSSSSFTRLRSSL